ncbi:cobalamin biosynthesis protein CobG, partial [Streptomyces sp. URMC 124]
PARCQAESAEVTNPASARAASSCALSVTAPLGRMTSAQWRLAARVAAEEGNGELRVTPWRGLVVPGLPAPKAPQLLAALADAGFVTSADSAWHRAGACAGRPGCAKSLADVRADAAHCLASGQPGGTEAALLPVYWSGCARRCGRPGDGRWVDVLATDGGYEVSLRGGGAPDGPVRKVAAAGLLPDVVAAARTATTT